ncbi:probable ATP-dependent RNA helicase DDX20 [Drosophila kikkawai]|uniref:RNA helicase n=1 Tax=Drosophila kikkawai TaxID=30033 RepID=A0A6P4HSA2_DROKI|nr:probable ATP-dependent RNA helicase DDX20 [Drosophila kikkawai]
MQREIAHNLATGERRTKDVAPGKVKTFPELNLRHEIVLGLQRRNFLTPTMIQAAAIPIALSKKDTLVQSKSGTGKTLIYAIAALQRFDASIRTPQALVVVPTRELAVQVKDTFIYVGEFLPKLKVSYVIGGIDVHSDRVRIKDCQIVIGTPGRLLHLYRKNVLCVKNMHLLVLDEADQLYLQDGLRRHVMELIQVLPPPQQIQKIACSATYEKNLDELVAKSMHKPVLISNSERATVLLGIRQFVYELPRQINNIAQMNCKLDAVMQIFNLVPYEQVVLFASSKMRADSFRNYLAKRGVECHLISGAMSQEERSKVFDCYRYFTMRTLVATDVFARGVDSPHTNLIVNLDPPMNHVDYLHRIGRAGRFGSKGIAITLVYEGAESEAFKGILSKAHTGKSVLEFPKEAEKGLDFWNFSSYEFPYYIKEEESVELKEFPQMEGTSKGAGGTVEDIGEAPLKKDALTEEAERKKDALKDEEASADVDSSKKIEVPQEVEALPAKDDSKKNPMEEATPNMLENEAKIIDKLAQMEECFEEEDLSKKEDATKETSKQKDFPANETDSNQSASCALSQENPLPKPDKPEISVIACPKLKETLQEALKEDKLESSGEEEQPDSILKENVLKPNNSTNKPDKDTHKEQPPPIIKVTRQETENDIEKNKENQPNNQNTQYPDNSISPELSPSPSLTPLDLTQEQTLTPPAAPVNSINNKTYCLAAPTATSSLTLQAMVISNTVDDASSISSDGSMGSRSESFESLYSNSDVKQMWKKYLIIRRSHKRSAKVQTPKLMYSWATCKPVFRVKRKRKVKPKEIQVVPTIYLFPEPKFFRIFEKLEQKQTIIKRLFKYTKKYRMCNLASNLFLNHLYDAYNDIYGLKFMSEPKKSKENEPQNKLTVREAHRMNIPPVLAVDEDPATGSETSQHSEEFTDHEDDYEEEEELEEEYSSSGFVESNESASSGIDTSVYNNDSSSEGEHEYIYSEETDDSDTTVYSSESEEAEEEEEEVEATYTGSNVSLAGSSYQGSVSAEDDENDQSDSHQEVLALYQQMFQTQYQFIAAHVASQQTRP